MGACSMDQIRVVRTIQTYSAACVCYGIHVDLDHGKYTRCRRDITTDLQGFIFINIVAYVNT